MHGQARSIRPARREDIGALVTLLRRSWLTTWAPELPFSALQAFAVQDPASGYVEAMWSEFRIAEAEGEIVGMCHVMGDLIASLHVDPRAKRRGVGTALMDEAEERIAREHDRARLEVRAFNRDAIAFYEARGWTESGRYMDEECGAPVETVAMTKLLGRAGA